MATTTTRERAAAPRDGHPRAGSADGGDGAAHAQPAPLDLLLTEAAVGPVQRWNPGAAGAKAALKLAARPRTVARRGAGLGAELAKITVGRSEVGPSKGDRRFKDPAWTGNPAFRRLGQAYLAAGATLDGLLGDAELAWAEERRLRFAAENLVDALAP